MRFSVSEYTKIDVGCRGFRPRPYCGAYSAPQPPSWFKGSASQHDGDGEGREGL